MGSPTNIVCKVIYIFLPPSYFLQIWGLVLNAYIKLVTIITYYDSFPEYFEINMKKVLFFNNVHTVFFYILSVLYFVIIFLDNLYSYHILYVELNVINYKQ